MTIEASGYSFNASKPVFDPALHTAISKRNFALCHSLIQTRADVTARDRWGWTPLHRAAHDNWPPGYHLLIEKGADVNAKGAHDLASLSASVCGISVQGKSPLQIAIQDRHPEIARFLIEQGAHVEPQDRSALSSLLPIALHGGHFETVRCLVEKGGPLNEENKLLLGNFLRTAIRHGSPELVDLLLKQGAYPIRDALEIAMSCKCPAMIECLIKTGFWTNDMVRLSELISKANYNGYYNIVDCLIKHGVDKSNLLAMASDIESVGMICRLLDKKISPIALDAALKISIKKERFMAARMLIDAGARPAIEEKHEIERVMLSNGANALSAECFFLRRPRPYTLEVLRQDHFELLSDQNCTTFQKPLALLNMAAYEDVKPTYGAIAKYFRNEWLPAYKEIAKNFTVVRVVVDDPHELGSVIDKVRHFLPTLPILYWALAGHGNETTLELGKGLLLKSTDILIMKEISQRIDLSAIIALWGCLNAAGVGNLVEQFSKNVPQIVMGSPNLVRDWKPITIKHKKSKNRFLLTGFTQNHLSIESRIYKDGEEIVNGQSHISKL